ncbi:MAG: glycosyltransferase family 4 protein [Bacteroidales bacterium]|nr:glycosyltransferase family 4 protein [Bacteroidales bacterium]
MKIAIFNGAGQVDYMYGLVSGLSQFSDDTIDVLDTDVTEDLFIPFGNVRYYAVFRKIPRNSPFLIKARNTMRFYSMQFWYILSHKHRIIHFQWLDRFILVDRILLTGLARLCGHKVVLTVHNINAGKRDNRDNSVNRFSLRMLYKIANHLIVHTIQSKSELLKEFPIDASKVSVIRHGLNNRVACKGLSTEQSRKMLNIGSETRVVLFFGNIDYYKGLDLLIESLELLPGSISDDFRLVIAGNSKIADYTNSIISKIEKSGMKDKILHRISHIPDGEVEQYFMAADCIVLPYRNIYQSGVIFMAYTFGLPIIVSDIGNFRNDMVEGKTGFLLSSNLPGELNRVISEYFNSELYQRLPETREKIKEWVRENYSWTTIGAETRKLYESLL